MNKIIPQEDDTPHAEPASEREGESFGLWLRHQREGRGIELDEISKASKIGMAYLRAFEEERFEILPATVFAKGFLKQYALYVGMDPEEVVNFFLQSSQQAGVEDKSVSAGSRVRASARSNAGWLVLVGVLLLIVVFLVYSRSPGQGADPTEPSIPTERPMPLGSQSADVGLVVDATENDATENDATEDDETIIGETEAESPVVPFTV